MRLALIPLLLVVCPALTACGGSRPAGVPIEPPPASVMVPCRHPAEFLPAAGQGDWELIVGRIGDELIRCGEGKAVLGEWAKGMVEG